MHRFISSKIALYLALIFIAGNSAFFIRYFSDVPFYHRILIFAMLVLLSLGLVLTSKPDSAIKLRFPWLVLPLLLITIWGFMKASFGFMDVGAVLHHLKHGVETGSSPLQMVADTLPLFLTAIPIGIGIFVLVSRCRKMALLDRFTAVPLSVLNPMTISLVVASGWFAGPVEDLKAEYVEPEQAQRISANKPNILHIYLESAERNFGDRNLFGPAMDPLLPLEKRGLTATNIQQVQQTQWTIAGMVASQCGVPLIQPWLDKTNQVNTDYQFMNGAVCLSDMLKAQGYATNYLMGVMLEFAGTGSMLRSHNVDWVKGYDHLLATFNDPEVNMWGVSDQYVFEGAYNRIREIGKDTPWLMSVVTVGGHRPNGVTSRDCRNGTLKLGTSEPIVQGVECTNHLTNRFLTNLEKQGLLENTIVVIQSDHLAMQNPVSGKLASKPRANYFTVFGPGVQKSLVKRPASMMDVYPTLLELAGYQLPDRRAGLGVSLLSEAPTLLQKWGLEKLDQAILYDTRLKDILWGLDQQRMAQY